MHSSVVLSALFAALALSSPLAKPAVTTEVAYVTEVVKVYVDAAQTPAPEPKKEEEVRPARGRGQRIRYHWYWGGKDGKTSATTITEAETEPPQTQPVETSAVEPSSSSAVEAPAQEQSTEQSQADPEPTPEPAPEPTPTPEPTTEQAQASAPESTQEAYQPESTAESAPVQSQSSASGSPYQKACLDSHNIHRANHSAPALEWDDGLESTANIVASKCVFAHSDNVGGGGYGENLALGTAPENIADAFTKGFYNDEVMNYPGYGTEPDTSGMGDDEFPWGHFSQMVWKDTTKLACVTKDCASQGVRNSKGQLMGDLYTPYLTVCHYKGPNGPGNFKINGEGYAKNVLPPLGHPMVGPW